MERVIKYFFVKTSIKKNIIICFLGFQIIVLKVVGQTTADSLIKQHQELFRDVDTTKIDSGGKQKNRTKEEATLYEKNKFREQLKNITPFLDSLKSIRELGFMLVTGEAQNLIKQTEELPFISYDFTDGIYFGFATQDLSRLINKNWGINLGLGYGFGSHYWQAKLGFSKNFISDTNPLKFVAEVHKISDTRDSWKVTQTENSFTTFVLGNDNRDYFQRVGFSVMAKKYFYKDYNLQTQYRFDNYHELPQNTYWSVFGGNDSLKKLENVFEKEKIYEGALSSLIIGLSYNQLELGLNTWLQGKKAIEIELEILLNNFNKPTNQANKPFKQLSIVGVYKKEYIKNIFSLAINARYIQGFGEIPAQRYFTLGGLGSLNAYNKNEFYGSSGFIFMSDLFFNLLWNTNLIFTNDFGYVNDQNPPSGILTGLPSKLDDIKYSSGVGLGFREGVSIGIFKRLDKGEKPKFIFRLSSRF